MESKVKSLLKTRTNADLIEMWNETEKRNDAANAMVRGWIIDEVELRVGSAKVDKWIEENLTLEEVFAA